jgi:ABC-2 type transport system ATP-binding protein
MKKRLAIGCAIAHEPSVLLLDEPTAALDLVCKEAIYAYLRAFRAQGGIVVLATHDVHELQLCDAVYVLKDGVLHPYEGERDIDGFIGCLRDG